jgi:hypothetical protein
MPLEKQIQTILQTFMLNHKRMQVTIYKAEDGLQLSTQAVNQTTVEGRNKFQFGHETVWLTIRKPRQFPIQLACLSETSTGVEFKVLALDAHKALVVKHLAKLQSLATQK